MNEHTKRTKFCVNCGAEIDIKAEICPKCGVRQPSLVSGTGKNRLIAALFAIFLGGLGIHNFYLGRVWLGIAYLLFCWTGVPAVIGLIEGIIFLAMPDERFAEKYGGTKAAEIDYKAEAWYKISKKGKARASRAGAIRTRAVQKLTVILLLRARYLLKQPNRPPLFSEEVLVRAYRYESPQNIVWLSPEESLKLLSIASPDENIPLSEKKELVEMELESWGKREGDVVDILRERARELLESHKRIRKELAMGVRDLGIEPQLPPDLLGILVLQPVVRR